MTEEMLEALLQLIKAQVEVIRFQHISDDVRFRELKEEFVAKHCK